MTDETNAEPGGEEPAAGEDQEPNAFGDWFLGTLVSQVNGGGLELGVTLTVGGTLVSGFLIGGRKYFEAFRDLYLGDYAKDPGAEIFNQMFERYAAIYDLPEDDDDHILPPPAFIHLRDAKCFHPGGPIPSDGTFWRGRLEAVEGFSLGVLAVPPPEDEA